MPTLRDGRILVISIDSLVNPRRAHMRQLLDGVPFEFVDGVVVSDVNADLNEWCKSRGLRVPSPSTFFQPKPGDLGVLLAFMQTWEYMVRERVSSAWILEDDVVANPALTNVFEYNVPIPAGTDVAFVHPYGGFGMYCTYVTLAGAEKLVTARDRLIALDKPVDLALWHGDLPEIKIMSFQNTSHWLFVQASPLNDSKHSQRVAFNDKLVGMRV